MGLKQLYADIATELKSIKNEDGSDFLKYVGIWNNQLRGIREQKNDWISITYPAVFSEVRIDNIEQLGQKHQLWNFELRFHLIDDFYNNIDGNFEENTRVFDLADKLWQHFQTIKLPMCSEIVCMDQQQEHDHNNVYHYTQSYKGNYTHIYDNGHISLSGVNLSLSAITSTNL